MGWISGIFTAITSVFNYIVGRNNAKNAADVKTAKIGEEEAKEVDKTNDALEKRDVKEIQNELS